jgi:hypothetical protein
LPISAPGAEVPRICSPRLVPAGSVTDTTVISRATIIGTRRELQTLETSAPGAERGDSCQAGSHGFNPMTAFHAQLAQQLAAEDSALGGPAHQPLGLPRAPPPWAPSCSTPLGSLVLHPLGLPRAPPPWAPSCPTPLRHNHAQCTLQLLLASPSGPLQSVSHSITPHCSVLDSSPSSV